MKWNMKIGTVRIHGNDSVLKIIMNSLVAEGKTVTKTNSYIEFVLSKGEMSDREQLSQFSDDASNVDGVIAVEIYRGVKYNECYVDTKYDMSGDNFDVAMKYLKDNKMEREYFKFVDDKKLMAV